MKGVDLSVIIPCHNLEDWVAGVLESLCSQTNELGARREAIFLCDACTDRTHEIIEQTMATSNWEYYIFDTNYKCPGGARNEGLEVAKGEYIWFVDGDDWLVKDNAIDIFLGAAQKGDYDLLECEICSRAHPEGRFGGGTVWRFLIRRDAIGDLRFDNAQNGEDSRFAHALLINPELKIGKLEEVIYFYNHPRVGSQIWKARQKEAQKNV